MKPINVIRSIKEKKEDELLALAGVTGVDIGPKLVKGKRTAETAIRIYVEKKKKNVSKTQAIPSSIDGVKTDVIEAKFELHHRLAVEELKPHADTGTYNPLVGGISIGPCSAVDGFVFTGTLGCMVKDRTTGQMMMLSNYHVMAEKWSVGETQCQPSLVDTGSCPSDVVGSLVRSVLSEKVDGAVASITARSHQCRIHEIGSVKGKGLAAENMNVRKRGRTTGLTHGIVDSIDATVNVPYDDGVHTLKNQILINVDSSQSSEFGLGGDSGSVVVDPNNKVVGLYFAGTGDGAIGVANPIDAALDELNVDLCVEIIKDIRIEIPEKFWIFENWKDRIKEVAYEKPPLLESITFPWDRLINPPRFDRPDFGGIGGIEERIRRLEQMLSGQSGSSEMAATPSKFPKEKPEIKEWKEFKEKPEFKEFKDKPEFKELKEKEFKEKPEPKELKEKEKELKEKEIKEKPEPKELKEKPEPKELFEDGGQKNFLEGPRLPGAKTVLEGPTTPSGAQSSSDCCSVEARLAALEAKLGSQHFIGQQLRPDLSQGALKYE